MDNLLVTMVTINLKKAETVHAIIEKEDTTTGEETKMIIRLLWANLYQQIGKQTKWTSY